MDGIRISSNYIWMDGWVVGYKDGWITCISCLDEWMSSFMAGCTNGWVDGWMNTLMN